MIDLVYCPKDLLIFDIPLLYYYVYHISSIICCLFLEVYIFISYFCFTFNFLWTILWWRFWDFCNLSAILLPIKSPVASAVFRIALFKKCFKWICRRLLSMIKTFLTLSIPWLYLLLNFLLIFLPTVLPVFLAKD